MAYNIAHASAFTEAAVEWYFFPGLKTHRALTALGISPPLGFPVFSSSL